MAAVIPGQLAEASARQAGTGAVTDPHGGPADILGTNYRSGHYSVLAVDY